MNVIVPDLSLVVLIGSSGSGKTTFARKHFRPTEVLSSDACRGLVADDENDQSVNQEAFEVLHFIASKRLAAGKLTVVDATNVQAEARKPLVALAKQFHAIPVAIVLSLSERICQTRNRNRPDRNFGPHVVAQQQRQLRQSLRNLKWEGFRHIHVLERPEDVDSATVVRIRLWNNRKDEHGPFDIIGDVHGCFDELESLLERLGYSVTEQQARRGTVRPIQTWSHAEGRKAIFLGDLVDRGPKIVQVLRLVMAMSDTANALCVPGNHDIKLLRKLRGKNVQITHGLADSLSQLETETLEFKEEVARFIDGLVSHYVLDDGKLVVAHAGMKEEMQGRGSGKVREFALFGETTGETNQFGLPVRYPWAEQYRGKARVVYGHTPVPEPEWLNHTINIDTGCVFGGKLTALRYPENELVSVPARHTYSQPSKPFLPEEDQAPALSAQQHYDDLLHLEDVLGKRAISTRLHRNVIIREENATAALEVMSRFAANPKWLIYLPPTMAPCETSRKPGLLEHPAEAFDYYRHQGVDKVICQEKHMGSRAIVVLCRDEDVALKRFGVTQEGIGICYTRTGRRFFQDQLTETALLARLNTAAEKAGFWEEFRTGWVCFDCELMPWSVKAQELLRQQYAAVGAAATAALAETISCLEGAARRGSDVAALLESSRERSQMVSGYREAYGRYCWPVQSVSDLKLAPFHLLATEGAVHIARDHSWHLDMLARFCRADEELLLATQHALVDVTDPASCEEAERWWVDLTEKGGEGMVVKPLDFIAAGPRGLVQPAVKCRGPEYLRIIYGPEYTTPRHLERLRSRGLSAKRSLALREFALGIEALERFVRKEPLRRVHECVFGVLALESEPVDPRL